MFNLSSDISTSNPSARECPRADCGAIQFGGADKEGQRTLVCNSCGTVYCFVHGGAHRPPLPKNLATKSKSVAAAAADGSSSSLVISNPMSSDRIEETCAQYEKQVAEETRASQRLISTTAKPCPGCGIPVEKVAGCNHMKCEKCHTAFCWLCGREVKDDVFPGHYQWWNMGSCVNMQVLFLCYCYFYSVDAHL